MGRHPFTVAGEELNDLNKGITTWGAYVRAIVDQPLKN